MVRARTASHHATVPRFARETVDSSLPKVHDCGCCDHAQGWCLCNAARLKSQDVVRVWGKSPRTFALTRAPERETRRVQVAPARASMSLQASTRSKERSRMPWATLDTPMTTKICHRHWISEEKVRPGTSRMCSRAAGPLLGIRRSKAIKGPAASSAHTQLTVLLSQPAWFNCGVSVQEESEQGGEGITRKEALIWGR